MDKEKGLKLDDQTEREKKGGRERILEEMVKIKGHWSITWKLHTVVAFDYYTHIDSGLNKIIK